VFKIVTDCTDLHIIT